MEEENSSNHFHEGREYAILRIEELDKLQAKIKLLAKLGDGEKSAWENGWLSAEDVEASLGL